MQTKFHGRVSNIKELLEYQKTISAFSGLEDTVLDVKQTFNNG